jgi:hypothetical protein
LDRRLGWPQSQSAHCIEEKNLLPLPRNLTQFLCSPASSAPLYRLSYPGMNVRHCILYLQSFLYIHIPLVVQLHKFKT